MRLQKPTLSQCVAVVLFAACCVSPAYPADLDTLYGPLLKKGKVLYTARMDYLKVDEAGRHGQAAYDRFNSEPYMYSVANYLRLSPFSFLELELGHKEHIPSGHKRLTYSSGGALREIQKYRLKYFRDFYASIRARKAPVELYLDFMTNSQKSEWNWETSPNAPIYFSYVRTYYEDLEGGLIYLYPTKTENDDSALSRFKRPLLSRGQVSLETTLGYKRGKLSRFVQYVPGGTFDLSFLHKLNSHLIQKLMLRYGITGNTEVEGGLFYTYPLNYDYEYKIFRPVGTSSFVTGRYKLRDDFYVPARIRYRPWSNLELMVSSDCAITHQTLEYYEKDAADVITVHPSKKLTYLNTQPTLKIEYLYDNDKEIINDELSLAAKKMLRANQFLLEFKFLKDITYLRRNLENGSQNIIDPYNVFLYPADLFVGGTEYAAFLTGNYSKTAANVAPQNYHLLEGGVTYGLNDHLNAGIKMGYHSQSSLDHFVLHDLADRTYKFKSYFYFDFLGDMRFSENCLISFATHFVPKYETAMEEKGDPKWYRTDNWYFGSTLALRMLF